MNVPCHCKCIAAFMLISQWFWLPPDVLSQDMEANPGQLPNLDYHESSILVRLRNRISF